MSSAKENPKADGDIYYGSDCNKAAGIYHGFEEKNLAVSNVSSSVSFTSAMQKFLLKNDGGTECFINFDTAATTSSFNLPAGEEIEVYGVATAIHAITSSGTTTLKLSAVGTTTQSNSLKVYSASITDANVSTSISPSACGVIIRNVGTNKCYVTINEASTTNKYPVYPNELMRIGNLASNAATISTVQAICDTGLTTTLRIIAFSSW